MGLFDWFDRRKPAIRDTSDRISICLSYRCHTVTDMLDCPPIPCSGGFDRVPACNVFPTDNGVVSLISVCTVGTVGSAFCWYSVSHGTVAGLSPPERGGLWIYSLSYCRTVTYGISPWHFPQAGLVSHSLSAKMGYPSFSPISSWFLSFVIPISSAQLLQ
jgi:hypothetical protein